MVIHRGLQHNSRARHFIPSLCAEEATLLETQKIQGLRAWAVNVTEMIGELRAECFRKRKATRSRHRDATAETLNKAARKAIVRVTKGSKRRCISELRKDINSDPWGMGYRIATKRFWNTAPVAPMDPAIMRNIVDFLFPNYPVRESRQLNIDERATPFNKAELRMTTKGLAGRKAPGPGGIPNEVLKVLSRKNPDVLLDMFNAC